MAGREHGVTGVEGVLKVQLLKAISVKERWQRKFPVPAMEVPKTEVDMIRIWARGFPWPATKVAILQVSGGRGELTRHPEGMWGGGASLQDGSGATAGSAEVGISVERVNASERTWESEVAMIGEFGLAGVPGDTHDTRYDGWESGDVRGVRGLYRRWS